MAVPEGVVLLGVLAALTALVVAVVRHARVDV